MRRKISAKPKEVGVKLEKIVPDTSALIHGKLSKMLEAGELEAAQIIIPEIVVGELQAQTSRGMDIGFAGLEEIRNIRELAGKHGAEVKFVGERPSYEDVLLAKSGRIDALIQDVARKENAVLITCDLPQALVAEAQGVAVKYHESYEAKKKISIEQFLTEDTMSLHLKESTIPLAKRGKPGAFKLVPIREQPITAEELDAIQKEILDAAKYAEDSFIEYGEHGASVVQIRNLRIAIARPPFSDGLEITVVRPIVKLSLDDYKLSDKLKARLAGQAEGVLIAGPPGSGKTTFAGSIAEFYLAQKKIVKTMESPRDLQVPPEITQYAPLDGSYAKTADILLLVRPDYTVFDEVRKTRDFEVFADMRMAGIGMIGVVHATQAVDAVQRFIGRVELGVIPHVIDTIIYINDGKVQRVYSLALTVRVPSGMIEADLARPIVEVRDFETGKPEYEIYTYGEQTVVMPVQGQEKNGVKKLAAEKIKDAVSRFDPGAQIDFLSANKVLIKVANEVIPRIIGKEGKNVKALEEKLGVSIDIEPLTKSAGKKVDAEVGESGATVAIKFKKYMVGKQVNIFVEGDYLFTATVGHKAEIKVAKGSEVGTSLLRALAGRKRIEVFV